MGLGLYLEIQSGREGMSDAEFVSDMKKTVACCCRMAKGTVSSMSDERADGYVNTYVRDSWFSSVDAVVELKKNFNANFSGVVKTNHSRYPKKRLEHTMKEWPPGSHLVLQAKYEGVVMFGCGQKYNKRKVCCFIFNKEGRCYEAKCKDENSNTMTRDAPHPHVISKYLVT